MLPNKQTLQELFSNDPDVLIGLQNREIADLARKIGQIELIPGEKGEKGDVGQHGDNGLDGKDGKDGVDGTDGIVGKRGKDGMDGKNGRDGIDGTSITEDDIRPILEEMISELELGLPQKKVESLIKKHVETSHGKFSLAIATLRGDVMRNYGGHGGGTGTGGSTLSMEIPVGTVDGLNTVFTVSHTPIYIEVSGQLMVSSSADPTQYGYVYAKPTVTFVNPPTQTPHSYYNG